MTDQKETLTSIAPRPPLTSDQLADLDRIYDGPTFKLPDLPQDIYLSDNQLIEVPAHFPVITQPEPRPAYSRPNFLQRTGDRLKHPGKATKLGRMALVGLVLFAPGKGVVDRVADQFIDGGDQTTEMLGAHYDSHPAGDTLYDLLHSDSSDVGLLRGDSAYAAFEDMSQQELEARQEEFLRTSDAQGETFVRDDVKSAVEWHDAGEKSVSRLEDIFRKLDSGNTAAISKEASEVIAAHPDQFMTDKEVEQHDSEIDAAKSNTELKNILGSILKKYGKKLDFSELGTDMSGAKKFAKAIVKTLSVLPRQLVDEDMDFDAFKLTRNKTDDAAGSYLPGTNEYGARGLITLRLYWAATAPGNTLGDGKSISQVVGHEMTHSYTNGPQVFPGHAYASGAEQKVELAKHNLRYIFGLPGEEFSSSYSISSLSNNEPFEEARAEVGGDTFDGGYNSPDEVRQFGSPLNKDRLELINNIERNYPGAASVLISRTFEASQREGKGDMAQYLLLGLLLRPDVTRAAQAIARRLKK